MMQQSSPSPSIVPKRKESKNVRQFTEALGRQMVLYGGEHMDTVHQRLPLHLLRLLSGHQDNAGLRPVNARHHLRLQGLRSQLWRPLWPPLLVLRQVAKALVGPPGRGCPVLFGLFSNVGRRRRRYSPASGARDVSVHVRGGSCDVVL